MDTRRMSVRQKVATWLLPRINEVQNFKIQPQVEGDTLKVGTTSLRNSHQVRESASAISKLEMKRNEVTKS